jgi:hypothetical protein
VSLSVNDFRGVAALALLGTVGFAGGLALSPATASAQFWWNLPGPSYDYSQQQRYRAKQQRDRNRALRQSSPKAAKKPVEKDSPLPERAAGPLLTVVSIGKQRVTVYDSTGQIMRGPISSGTAGHRTPTGIFHILQKNKFHRSNIYSGAPMPFMQRLTWSGIALHAGHLPGYPASHGCIRLTHPFATKLFALSKMGMRVVVAPDDPAAEIISHRTLPSPIMVAAEPAPDRNTDAQPQEPVRVAAAEGAEAIGTAKAAGVSVTTRFVNPMQRAEQRRNKLRVAAKEAPAVAKQALAASVSASEEARAAVAALRDAETAHTAARTGLEAARAALAAATAESKPAAGQAVANAEAVVKEAAARLAEAKAAEAVKSPAAFAAAVASREADEAVTRLADEARAANKSTEPIALFISMRTGKIYGSQGWIRLFEEPITIKNPGQPIGTHLYVALSGDDTSGQLGWKSISIPSRNGGSNDARPPVRRGAPPPIPAGPASSAKEALDRIELTDDLRKRIGDRLWSGASLMISDNGPGNETGKYTDYIVQTY